MKKIFLLLALILMPLTAKAQNTVSVLCSGVAAAGVNAKYSIKVDGVTVNSSVDCAAVHGSGNWQTNNFTGNWATTAVHQIVITFTNDYYVPPANRDLYIKAVSLDGTAATGTTAPATSPCWCGWNSTTSEWLLGAAGSLTWSSVVAVVPPPTPVLSSLTITPTSLVGGASADGVVALSVIAPAGNVVVSLTSNSPNVIVPNNVTVAAGSVNAHFGVTTTASTTVVTGTVGAAYGGVSKTASLTVNPPPKPSPPLMTVIGATVTLTNSPAPPVTTHTVALAWQPGAPPANGFAIASFNVYRGTVQGGPYSKIGNVASPTLAYTDSNVSSATTYYYVVTTVDTSNQESANSNEAAAVIP